MDTRLALLTGIDIPIPECQLVVHQPTIEEISYIGENSFFIGVQTLCLHKQMFVTTEDKSVLDTISNFQIFMMIMTDKETKEKKNDVMQVLKLIFPNYKVFLSPSSLIFQQNENSFLIDENNFDFLQNTLREIFCSKSGPMDQQAFNPANAKAKEIAEKLMRGRQRVAEQKGAANISVFGTYLSVLAVSLHTTIPTLAKTYTMYMLYDQMERFALYTNWDIDLKIRLAGGKPESSPENWMKNIH